MKEVYKEEILKIVEILCSHFSDIQGSVHNFEVSVHWTPAVRCTVQVVECIILSTAFFYFQAVYCLSAKINRCPSQFTGSISRCIIST